MTYILLSDDMTETELIDTAAHERAARTPITPPITIAQCNCETCRPCAPAPANYWTRTKVARLSDDALDALLDSGEISPDEVVALEAEQEARDYDASDPASPQNTRS
jgi:hypothetical protein